MTKENVLDTFGKNKKSFPIVFIIFMLLFFLITIIVIKKGNEKHKIRIAEFPLVKSNMLISDLVINSECFKGATLLTLVKGKYSLPNSRNFEYLEYSLCKFLSKGDSLNKAVGSDTLYIIRSNRKYYFILSESLNEKVP